MKTRLLNILALSLSLSACASTGAVSPPPAVTTSPQIPFSRGMVSAADPRAAEAGAQMLRRGGSATDAAIATMLALTVVEPQSSGIGGGGFYLRGTIDGAVETLDGRETAPATANPEWFLDKNGKPLAFPDAVISGLSVGVPGNIALAAEAHRRHGKLPWTDLFAPAITLARDGWTASERFHLFLTLRPQTAGHDPAGRALFFDPSGDPVAAGTMLRNPALAESLARIARDGPQSFYRGAPAKGLANKVAAQTPHAQGMTAADIESYRARERAPVCGVYRLYRICGMGPPSSGATTVIAILGQLEAFDMASLSPDSALPWHLFAESQRLAYADRERFLADSDFVPVPVDRLIAPSYLARRGSLIRPDETLETVGPGLEMPPPDGAEPQENGTSHFVVVDRDGNAVSYTSTIESAFGSGLMFGGFYLNNELTDFSFTGEKDGVPIANRVEGGKRPRSSMAPTLVYGPSGDLVLTIGAAGGATIPVQVARALIGYIDWKMPISKALALPVLFSPGDVVMIEEGSKLETLIPDLKALGHAKIMPRRLPIKTNAIAISGEGLAGAADPRSEGQVVSE